MLLRDQECSFLYTPTIFDKLLKSGKKTASLTQQFPASQNTSELFNNAKRVFNICSVTLGGNLYQTSVHSGHGKQHKMET